MCCLCRAPEVLFDPTLVGLEAKGIHHLVRLAFVDSSRAVPVKVKTWFHHCRRAVSGQSRKGLVRSMCHWIQTRSRHQEGAVQCA